MYYLVKLIHIFFTLLVVAYTLVYHGELKYYGICSDYNYSSHPNDSLIEPENEETACPVAVFLPISISTVSLFLLIIHTTKIFQNRHSFDWSLLREYIAEDFLPLMGILLFVLDFVGFELQYDIEIHRILAGVLVLVCCHSMAYTMSRDPDNAIFVEMMFKIMGNLCKFMMSYIWLFVGWSAAFHVVMSLKTDSSEKQNSFHDIGSAIAKTVSMFTGDLGFETENGINSMTNFEKKGWFGFLLMALYIIFIFEMSVVLMNQLIGLAICNIQELAEDADGLRLVKEVMFQKYMESLLNLLPSLPKRFRRGKLNNLGQLVTKDIYNGNAVYCVDQDQFDSGTYTLQLTMKETTFINNNVVSGMPARQMYSDGTPTVVVDIVSSCNIPSNVVNKLKYFIQGSAQKIKEKEENDQKVVKLLLELKEEKVHSKTRMDKVEELCEKAEILFERLQTFTDHIREPSTDAA